MPGCRMWGGASAGNQAASGLHDQVGVAVLPSTGRSPGPAWNSMSDLDSRNLTPVFCGNGDDRVLVLGWENARNTDFFCGDGYERVVRTFWPLIFSERFHDICSSGFSTRPGTRKCLRSNGRVRPGPRWLGIVLLWTIRVDTRFYGQPRRAANF